MYTFEIDGVTFDAVATTRVASSPKHFGVRKPAWMIERYRELADEFHGSDIVELGIDQGSSTAMLALLLAPRRMAALDIAPGPIPALDHLLDARHLDDRVTVHWGVDQSDARAIEAVVRHRFDDSPLDLIVDDASHALEPTVVSFNLLFPRLRDGGLFIIEDWSHDHQRERRYADVIDAGDEQGRRLTERISASVAAGRAPNPTLSRLILQLVVVAARAPDVVTDLRIRAGWCEVRRGPAVLDSGFRLADHLGSIGRTLVGQDANT